jgi:putative transport protein
MSDALEWFAGMLRRFPEIAVFLTLGLGFLIGRIKVKGFGLGTVVGTLVVGMIVGQAHIEVPTFARTLFFLLFMFGTGYHVGPQFFVTLRRGGLGMVMLSLTFAFVGLIMVVLVSWFLKLDAGFTGGLLSGALTQSSVIGTASDAIHNLPLPEDQRALLISHVPVGDAVTYLFGTIGVTILLTKVFPAIMRVSLKDECKKFEQELGASLDTPQGQSAFEAAIYVDVQAFRVTNRAVVGMSVAELLKGADERAHVARVRRGKDIFTPDANLTLELDDVVVLSGPREELLRLGKNIGEQVVDAAAMQVPFQARTIIVTNSRAVGLTRSELRALDEKGGAGLHVRRVLRQGQPVPLLPKTVLERGDAVEMIGTVENLDRATALLGVADIPTDKTNFVLMGLAIALGAIIGAFAIHIKGIALGMGTGGGALLAGLFFGWLQTRYPALGRIPSPAIWLMENLGLNTFIALVGIAAGPHAVEAIQSSGWQLLLASVVVATVPHAITFALGWYGMGLNAGQLMGALSGAGTITAGLQSLVDESESSVPVLGYTVPFAINNILLTAWGPVVVAASQLWNVSTHH